MGEWLKKYCDYLSRIYNCSWHISKDTVFIISNSKSKSIFKFSLRDKNLSCYTLFHKNASKIKETYHPQFKSKNIKKIIFHAMVHDFYKEENLFYTDDDFYRTITDLNRDIADKELRSKYISKKYIHCPICNRKISILNKNNLIRHTIHCRCKLNQHHTTLSFKTNKGYYLVLRDENYPLIQRKYFKVGA